MSQGPFGSNNLPETKRRFPGVIWAVGDSTLDPVDTHGPATMGTLQQEGITQLKPATSFATCLPDKTSLRPCQIDTGPAFL